MAEPQPPNIEEGADAPNVLPANAEDRKAAKAMSSLDSKLDDDSGAPKKEVDLKALNDAMKNLGTGEEVGMESAAAKKQEVSKAPVVKVEAGSVALLVGLLDNDEV